MVERSFLPWRIAGAYFESCNCEAICPCRMVGGRPGGRSTYGTCFGALCWLIDEGCAGEVDLGGLAAALVYRYDDDEPRSPWTFVVHVDQRGDELQRTALGSILVGRLGGEQILGLPWVRKPSELVEVRASPIAIEHPDGAHVLRVGGSVSVRASRPVRSGEPVACIVPGYHRPGTELYADELRVHDAPFDWDLEGNCAFAADFAYSSG